MCSIAMRVIGEFKDDVSLQSLTAAAGILRPHVAGVVGVLGSIIRKINRITVGH